MANIADYTPGDYEPFDSERMRKQQRDFADKCARLIETAVKDRFAKELGLPSGSDVPDEEAVKLAREVTVARTQDALSSMYEFRGELFMKVDLTFREDRIRQDFTMFPPGTVAVYGSGGLVGTARKDD